MRLSRLLLLTAVHPSFRELADKNSGNGSQCAQAQAVIASTLNRSVSLVSPLAQDVDLHMLIRNRLNFESKTCDIMFFETFMCAHVL